jgi:hypothetical protein
VPYTEALKACTFGDMEIAVMIVLGLIVAGYVLIPLQRGRPVVAYDWDGTGTELREERRALVEKQILEYRAALRAGTLCTRCARANPADSQFCAGCGRPLAGERQPEAEPETVTG